MAPRRKPLAFHLITLFADACEPYLSASILGRAREKGAIKISYQNPRDFVPVPKGRDKATAYKKVDERPYGGGPGMVMAALPVAKAIEKAVGKKKGKTAVVWFEPGATAFDNKEADTLSKFDDVVLVCGRYEGIDARAKAIAKTFGTLKTYSVGEAVYTGGELPAMAIVDAVTRRLPGVLGKDASVEERRVAARDVYTRPEALEWKGKKMKVPKVLLTGHHANIDTWKGGKQ
jgi:tRNA (guanine37-N1)-methyltransferase